MGVIYLVRDPRDVAISYAHHNDQTLEETVEMINKNYVLGLKKNIVPTYLGSWSNNYNSWRVLNKFKRYFCIKYEDLITDKEKVFKEILIFIKHLSKMQFEIDVNKIKKVIENIQFEKLKKMELEVGFHEAKKNNVAIIVRVPLASGLLTGKMNNNSSFPKNDHRNYNINGDAFDVGETFSGVNFSKGLEISVAK